MKHKTFPFDEIQFVYFFLLFLVLLMPYLKSGYKSQSYKDSPLCFLLMNFTVLALTIRSLVHLELVFVYATR